MRVLENAEPKYTLEELLNRRRSRTLQPLCCKIPVAIKRRSQNARWILNQLEREPCLADGAAGRLGEGRIVFWLPVSREPWKPCSTVLLIAAAERKDLSTHDLGAFGETDEGSGLDEMYKKALRAQLHAENTEDSGGAFLT